MKKVTIYRVLAVVFSFLLFSCQNLDEKSNSTISLEESFKDVKSAKRWSKGLYNSLRNNVEGTIMTLPEVQADMLNATKKYGNVSGDIHRWMSSSSMRFEYMDYWKDFYFLIRDANIMIEYLPKVKTFSEEEETEIKIYLAEAYFSRAYAYSMLVRRFSEAYTKENENTPSKGLPLVTKVERDVLVARSTIKETYDLIFSDLQEAEKLFEETNTEGKFAADFINIDVVKMLKARSYLYINDSQRAFEQAESVIKSGNYRLVSNKTDFEQMWHGKRDPQTNKTSEVQSLEDIFSLYVSKPDELPAEANDYYLRFNFDWKENKIVCSPYYMPTKQAVDLYETGIDFRGDVYFTNQEKILVYEEVEEDGYLVNKFRGIEEYFTESLSNYVHRPKVFRLAEAYLIASEAAFNNGDESNALHYLNELRKSRGLDEVYESKDALFEEIKQERTRELAFEGFRLDDLKRWKMPVERGYHQAEKFLMTSPESNFIKFRAEPNNPRFVWPIPGSEIQINSKMIQNEGW